jgi:hypothetical protein
VLPTRIINVHQQLKKCVHLGQAPSARRRNASSEMPSTLLDKLLRHGLEAATTVEVLEETLTRRKAQLSASHPETLQSMSTLAVCYRCLGRRNEALQLIEKAIPPQKAQLGADHPDTLASMHSLACIRFALGQHTEALKSYEDVLALRKAKFDASHPDVLNSIREMAGLRLHDYAKTGDLAGCRAMAEMCEKLEPSDLPPFEDSGRATQSHFMLSNKDLT